MVPVIASLPLYALHAAQRGDSTAAARIGVVSDQITLAAAQLAVARQYGFASWARMKLEVERRDILNSRDLSRLTRLLAVHPELATGRPGRAPGSASRSSTASSPGPAATP